VSEDREWFPRLVEALREPVRIDPALDRRIMRRVAGEAVPRLRWHEAVRDWLTRGRPVRLTPLGGMALAAAALSGVVAGRFWISPPAERPAVLAMPASVSGAPAAVQFVAVAPGATSVTLVGDFNDWNVAATPMHAASEDGIWSVSLPLPPGRYRYAFLVDGTRWMADPAAPAAADSDFGSTNSVVTVGEP
jgi:hypothetical protein